MQQAIGQAIPAFFALACAVAPLTVHADTLRVPDDYPTIQGAVNAAAPGDMVLVASGVYEEHIIISVPNLTLRSEVIGGAVLREEWVIFSTATGITVSGFDIRSTTNVTYGAITLALYGDGFFVDSCKFSKGRPCVSLGGDGTIRNCSISDAAGGLLIRDGANIFIENCDFLSNADMVIGGQGGLMILTVPSDPEGCDVTISDCRFVNNGSFMAGGAVRIEGATQFPRVTIERSFFHDNEAMSGPVVHCLNSQLTLRSCTLVGNLVLPSSIEGGVISFELGSQRPSTVERCIIADNDGPAMKCFLGSSPTVLCSDIFGNRDNQLCGIDGGNNFSLDPLFCKPGTLDFSLQPASPCAPPHSPAACGLIGALSVGCVSSVESTTWGTIKNHYRK